MSSIFRQRLRSFTYAFAGLYHLLRREPNFIIHAVVAVLVIAAGLLFSISRAEWILVVLTIGIVMAAEAVNTSIEKLCDRFLTQEDDTVKTIKDVAAAAVLIVSLAAVVVGLIIFLPYVIQFVKDLN